MGKRMKTIENERKDRIMFHWELSPFKKKPKTGNASPIVYRPVLHRGKTLSTEAVIQEYLNESGLKAQLTPGQLQLIVNGLLKSMVTHTLTDGRCRALKDFFTLRLDMKGTAERRDEPYNPQKHKFTLNFQKARRFSAKSKKHRVEVVGIPTCEIPLSHSVIKDVHSYGAEVGIVYPGREIYICGKDLNLGPYAQIALQVNYPVHATTWDCEIVSTARDEIIVNSPKAFRAAYMKESAYGLAGEIILYRNDAKPRQQSAHGSRFKVSFRKPPKGK